MTDLPDAAPPPDTTTDVTTGGGRARRRLRPTDVIDDHRLARGGVGRDVQAGVRWLGTSQTAIQIVSILMYLILVRLLSPAEFGIVTLMSVLTGLFDRVFGDTGTGAALIRQPVLRQALATSVFWLNVMVGALTSLFFVALGGPIASLLGEADRASMVRVVGLTALFGGFGHAQRAMLRRTRRFGSLAAVNVTNAILSSVAAIVFAIMGWGAWALVWGSHVGTVSSIALAWALSRWRPTAHYSADEIRSIRKFSANLSLQSLFGYISFAGDRFVIGRFVGTTELGYYGLSNRILRYPLQTSAQTYREVMLPTLARIQDDHVAMREAYRRTLEGITFLIVPICLAATALAGPLIPAVLGQKWIPATDVMRIMALVAALQAITTTTGSIYNAKGRTDLSFRWQLVASIVMMTTYSLGAFWGVTGVAWGFLIGIAALSYPAFRIPLGLIEARPHQVLSGTVQQIAAAAVAAGAAWVTTEAVGTTSPWPPLLAGAAVMVAIYGGYAIVMKPQAFKDLLRTVGARKRKRRPAGARNASTGAPTSAAQLPPPDSAPAPP